MLRRVLTFIASLFHERRISDRAGGGLYLSRYYLLGGPRDAETFDDHGAPTAMTKWSWLPFNIMLHKFHMSDDAGELHSHPWRWSLAIILAGGYREERRVKAFRIVLSNDGIGGTRQMFIGYRVANRLHKPWRPWAPWRGLNVIRATDYHRVDLLEKDSWSLFISGPRVGSWGFWDRETGETMPWRAFYAAKVKQGERK